MARKVEEHFQSGSKQVWHMFPETQTVTVFHFPAESVTYQPEDELDLSDIFPSFRTRVSDLFGRSRSSEGTF